MLGVHLHDEGALARDDTTLYLQLVCADYSSFGGQIHQPVGRETFLAIYIGTRPKVGCLLAVAVYWTQSYST